MKKDASVLNKILIVSVLIVLAIYTLSIVLMLSWALITSLKSSRDFFDYGNLFGFPDLKLSKAEFLRWKNYTEVFKHFTVTVGSNYISGDTVVVNKATYGFTDMLLFSLLYAGGGCIISTFVPCVMAYACVKYPYKSSKIIYTVALLIMIIPIVGNFPSEITLLRRLGLYDSMFGNYIQKFNFTGMYFFVFYAFFESLPDSYAEAAEIDGASQASILVRVVLPLASKIIASVMLIMFITYWDDYTIPHLYLPSWPTLAFGVYDITRQGTYGTGVATLKGADLPPAQMTVSMILALPILILFIALKDKIMGNMSLGGLKE